MILEVAHLQIIPGKATDFEQAFAQAKGSATKADVQAIATRIENHYAEWKESTFPGLLGNVVAGRIANRLDLGGSNYVTVGGSYSAVSGQTLQPNGSFSVNDQGTYNSQFVNLPANGLNGFSAATMGVSLFSSSVNHALNLEISALEADGRGRIVSSPRVITADQTKALIEQGTEYPYSVTAPNGATTLAFKKAVLKLEVTPQVTPEGNIILDLDIRTKNNYGRHPL